MTTTLTTDQQTNAADIIAAWVGPRLGHDGPAPIGEKHYRNASGFMLDPEWEPHFGDGTPRPTLLMEGNGDLLVEASLTNEVTDRLRDIGVFAEPLTSYALGLYPRA